MSFKEMYINKLMIQVHVYGIKAFFRYHRYYHKLSLMQYILMCEIR